MRQRFLVLIVLVILLQACNSGDSAKLVISKPPPTNGSIPLTTATVRPIPASPPTVTPSGDVLDQANQALEENEPEKALQLLEKQTSPAANALRAVAFLDLERLPEAVKEANLALQTINNRADIYNTRGLAFLKQDKIEEALQDFQTALKIEANSAETYNNLGSAQIVLDDLDGAINSFQQAIKLNPAYTTAYYHLGGVFYLQVEYEKAIEHFQAAVRLDAKQADVLVQLGMSFLNLSRLEEAEQAFSSALTFRNNGDPDLLLLRGIVRLDWRIIVPLWKILAKQLLSSLLAKN
jgi:tetratricopeptide (TPR) repeat protein